MLLHTVWKIDISCTNKCVFIIRGARMTEEGTFTCMQLVDQRKPIYSIYSIITKNIMTSTTAWTAIDGTLLTRGKN